MNFFKTSAILSFALLICAPAHSMSSYFSNCPAHKGTAQCALETVKENPIAAGLLGVGFTASTFYLYKSGFFHAAALKAKNTASAFATSETIHAVAAGVVIGAGTGCAAEYLENRGMPLLFSWIMTVPLRYALLSAYQTEMGKNSVPFNENVFDKTAQIADWAAYLRNARFSTEQRIRINK